MAQRKTMEIKQEVLDIAFLETIFGMEFCFINGFYYPESQDRYIFRFTHEQVQAEKDLRNTYK